jgi:hypothetical protein
MKTHALRLAAATATLVLAAACSNGDASEAAPEAPAAPAAPAAAVAPVAGALDPAEYRLTMDKVRHWARVRLAVKEVIDAQPELEDVFVMDADDTLDGHVAEVEAVPALRSAVEGAGMSVREQAVITTIFVEGALVEASAQLGQDPATLRDALTTHPDNLVFLREHAAEIRAVQAQAAAAEGIPEDEA